MQTMKVSVVLEAADTVLHFHITASKKILFGHIRKYRKVV